MYDTEAGDDTLWSDQWTIFYPGSNQVDSDADGYVGFLLGLIETGVIKPCPTHVLERMRSDLESQVHEASDKATHVPSYRAICDRLGADLKAIETEIESRTVRPLAPEQKPKPARGKRGPGRPRKVETENEEV